MIPTSANPITVNGRKIAGSAAVWIILLTLFVAATIWIMWPKTSISLDPESPGPDGAKAVAEVLRSKGVALTVVHNKEQLQRESARVKNTSATLLITASGQTLDSGKIAREVVRDYRNVVGVGLMPADIVDAGWQGLTRGYSSAADPIRPSCLDPVVEKTNQIAPEQVYEIEKDLKAETCFPIRAKDDQRMAQLVIFTAQDGLPRADFLSSGAVLANKSIPQQSHATLALHLLSRNKELIWFSPTRDAAEANPDKSDAKISWLEPMIKLTLWTLLALVLWQGRRFGRLVSEPLPVVVKATETTLSRGRLYHRCNARQHSLAILQAAARYRMARHLGISKTATAEELIALLVIKTKRDRSELVDLLQNTCADDKEFITKARALVILEEESRR